MAKFVPYEYQRVAKEFVIENKKCGLFLDMGLWQNSNYLYGFR